jgi:Rps23 Pro-64 3,4-dihydroxylase Tpa1-like proline 4-hydroxylase
MIHKRNDWNKNKVSGYARTHIDEFLDEETCLKLYEECISAPTEGWTVFTRAGSRMEEFNDLISCPTAHQVTYDLMHSGEFLYDLEQLTGIVGLLPDPHLVGAGFSILRNGSELSPHYDFNWNDRLRLHRKLTTLLYITPDWEDQWGGHNITWTSNPDLDPSAKIVESISPKFNRFIISENVSKGPIHSVSKVNCPTNIRGRCAIRFFYYISSSQYDPNNLPHKSIYSTNDYSHHKLTEDDWTGRIVGEDFGYKRNG